MSVETLSSLVNEEHAKQEAQNKRQEILNQKSEARGKKRNNDYVIGLGLEGQRLNSGSSKTWGEKMRQMGDKVRLGFEAAKKFIKREKPQYQNYWREEVLGVKPQDQAEGKISSLEAQAVQLEAKGAALEQAQKDLAAISESANLKQEAQAEKPKQEISKSQMKDLAEIFDKHQPHFEKKKNSELAEALDKGELNEEQAKAVMQGLEMLIKKNPDIKLPFANLEEIKISATKTENQAETKLSAGDKESLKAFGEMMNYFTPASVSAKGQEGRAEMQQLTGAIAEGRASGEQLKQGLDLITAVFKENPKLSELNKRTLETAKGIIEKLSGKKAESADANQVRQAENDALDMDNGQSAEIMPEKKPARKAKFGAAAEKGKRQAEKSKKPKRTKIRRMKPAA